MRKLLFLLFPMLAVATASWSQSTDTLADSPKALLWKISGNGLEQPSWLFGTIHMIGKDDFFLGDSTRAAIEAADRVVFEIDMAEMTDLFTQLGLLREAFMKDNLTLRDLLSDEDYALVKEHFRKMGLPLIFFERMKPMFLSMFAEMDFSQSLGSGEMVSYEMEILELAQRHGKQTGGLETASYQMSLFDSIPYADQAKMLVESIRAAEGMDQSASFDEMVRMYKSRDIERMAQIMESEGGFSQYNELLLNRRNRNWIPIMKDMMDKQACFFAVGAGHLGGPHGVVALLKKEGYVLTPVE